MQIYRYALSNEEVEAIAQIARVIGPVEPDGKLVSRLVQTGPKWGKTNTYSVNIKGCPAAETKVFQQLALRLSKQIIGSSPKPLVVLENIPLEFPAASLLLMGQMYGLIDEYYEDGAAIDSITDRNRVQGQRPRSTNNLHFPLHTDLSFSAQMPTTIYFLVVTQAAEGGSSTFCDIQDVVDDLSTETIATLANPYRFPAPPHRPEKAPLDAPILEGHRSSAPLVRYRRDGLELLGSLAERDRQGKALEEFERAIEANTNSIRLERGELAIWRNRQILHGRDAFADGAECAKEKKRLALRTYVTTV